MKASARKSFGEYKPIIIHPHMHLPEIDGRTEVVGQRGRLEVIIPQTKHYQGPTEVWHSKRGVTFVDRSDAVAYAQCEIERRNAARAKARADYEARQNRYKQQRAARA